MSDKKEIKAGDVVKLKSGGPKMTVEKILDKVDSASCVWFDGNESQEETYKLTSLKKVDKSSLRADKANI